jgi:hypothetical protein
MDNLPEPVCADCVGFVPKDPENRQSSTGRCLLRKELGDIPPDLKYCSLVKVRSGSMGKVIIPDVTKAKVARGSGIRRDTSVTRIERRTLESPIIGDTTGVIDMDKNGLKAVLRELLEEETLYGYPDMGAKWLGGKLVLEPSDPENQSKEIPIEAFFHKIVMLRDRIRVLEAKLNGNKTLLEQEKVELQGYISKCYGTLTTFNVLFAEKEDQFSSK